MSDAITVEIVDVAGPMIVASSGFLKTLESVESTVAALKITDAASAQEAANIQSRLTTAAKTLDTQRKALNKPFDDQIKAINAAAAGPQARIQQAKDSVARALTAFAQEQDRLAREAEKKRQADLAALQEKARLERIETARVAQEAETKRLADLAALQEKARLEKAEAARIAAESAPVAQDDDWGEPAAPAQPTETEKAIEALAAPVQVVVAPTETEKALVAIQQAPAVVVAKPSGVAIRVTLQAVVKDLTKVPDIFIEKTIKLRAIQSTFCSKWKEGDPMPVCAGIEFTVDRQTVSTGR